MRSTKVCQGLRPVLYIHTVCPFLFLRWRVKVKFPRPCLQTQYLATAGALEVMSTNRCCSEMFLLLNCSKHVSVFLDLGMFWCAHKLYRHDLGLGSFGERYCSLTAGLLWSSGAGQSRQWQLESTPQDTQAATQKEEKKTHSSPYLLLEQEHGDMEWKLGGTEACKIQ